jgi:site-specific DNA recombinase
MPTLSRRGDDPVKPVGIWIRVSTEDQVQGDSPEHHEQRARSYAEGRGWSVKEVYRLEAVSGKTVMGHAETVRMLEDVRSGRIQALIFSKLARLARNSRELLEFSDRFQASCADLVSLGESIDTSTPAGRLFYTVIAAMAQWEREEIAARVSASVPVRAKLGKSLGGAAPFGYQWVGHDLKPDPGEAPIRRLLYELFLEHKRRKTVARLLNEAGHRTRNGSRFSDTTVLRLLQDPTAKGERRANYTKSRGDGKSWDFKPVDEWVLIPVEPIVPKELWNACNALLDEQRDGRKPVPGPRPVHLFTGLVRCQCGEKMSVPSNTPKYVCLKCRTKIRVTDLEAVFQEQLKGFFLSPEEITRYLAEADETIRARQEALQALEEERRGTQREMEKVYRAYVSDELPMEAFGRQYRPLEERVRQLETEIPRFQGELDVARLQLLSQDEILAGGTDLCEHWPALDFASKRQIVETMVHAVTVGKEEVAFDLAAFPLSPQAVTEKQQNFTGSSPRARGSSPGSAPCPTRGRCRSPAPRAERAAPRERRAGTRAARRGTARRDVRASPRPGGSDCRRRGVPRSTPSCAARGTGACAGARRPRRASPRPSGCG